MKKITSLILALAMCMALCVPAWAEENASVVPMQTGEDYLRSGPYFPPSGYTYVGRYEIKGSWIVDSFSMSAGLVTSLVLSASNPVLGIITSTIAGSLAGRLGTVAIGDRLDRTTYDYRYSCDNPGIYPYIYYHIYYDYVKTADGSLEFVESREAYEYALLPRSA